MSRRAAIAVVALGLFLLGALAAHQGWLGLGPAVPAGEPSSAAAPSDPPSVAPTAAPPTTTPPAASPPTTQRPPPFDPRWHLARPAATAAPNSGTRDGKTGVVPYMQGVKAAPAVANVTAFDPAQAWVGLNLMVSGHAPEAVLMDMKGNVLHRWRRAFQDVWPGPLPADEGQLNTTYWRRAHLFRNGDLLAIFEGIGLIKLDKASNLLWAYRGHCHHDIDVDPQGRIYTLTRHFTTGAGSPWLQGDVIDDHIAVLSPDGAPLQSVSVLECILRSPFVAVLGRRPRDSDVLHTNTIELLDGRHAARRPMLRQGDVLISVRNLDLIAVADLEERRLTWATTAISRHQHQPTVVGEGNLLVFDNRGNHGDSRVLEFDPLTQQVVWSYAGTADVPLHSPTLGSCQRLPNGNTLITESEPGRVIEVTPEQRIVWEYFNPFRAGDRNELIASVFEVVRLGLDYPQFPEVRAALERGVDLPEVQRLLRELNK